MVNQEIFGGLISALSRGESLHKAMFSLFNAGYKKEDIEEAALLLKSNTLGAPSRNLSVLKQVAKKPEMKTGQKIAVKISEEKKSPEKKEEKTKQVASKYGEQPEEFKKIIDEAIKNLTEMKSPVEVVKSDSEFKPPIIIQRVSEYGMPRRRVSKFAIVILFFLLVLLLGSLAALFIFKDKLIEIFNNFGI